MTNSESSTPIHGQVPLTAPPPGGESDHELLRFHRALRAQAGRNSQLDGLVAGIFDLVQRRPRIVGAAWYCHTNGGLTRTVDRLTGAALERDEVRDWIDQIVRRTAYEHDERIDRSPLIRNLVALTTPVPMPDGQPAVLMLLVADTDSRIDIEVLVMHSLVGTLMMWLGRSEVSQLSWEIRSTSAILELIGQLESCDRVNEACLRAVNAIRELLNAQVCAIGLRPRPGSMIGVGAVSGLSCVDQNSATTRRLRAAMEESIARDQMTAWPPAGEQDRHQALSHRQLVETTSSESVLSVPLRTDDGRCIGAIVCLGGPSLVGEALVRNLFSTLSEPLGSVIDVVRRVQGGRLRRLWRGMVDRKTRCIVAAVACIAGIQALFVPVPYRIQAECVAEPVVKRFSAAPYDGLLEQSLVEAGDVVKTGQLLARMDGREIRLRLAGVSADHHRAAREHDSHMARHEVPDALMADLEKQRLSTEADLLEYRERKLEIRSPIEGLVLQGSVDRQENVPVTTGQVLFEVAPIDRLRIELAIPAFEIAYVRPGMEVELQFDGRAGETVSAVIDQVRPRSEIRDSENVFVAEVEISNDNRALRPGMKGTARVTSERHAIGWNLFHRPWERLTTSLWW